MEVANSSSLTSVSGTVVRQSTESSCMLPNKKEERSNLMSWLQLPLRDGHYGTGTTGRALRDGHYGTGDRPQ